mmetsp:Transcript_2306/g.8584  ORF Transcript_2306/g.8584 Transcript_2306/m.8584 type:complete len:131 (-) Transcript_2306:149-541(-)
MCLLSESLERSEKCSVHHRLHQDRLGASLSFPSFHDESFLGSFTFPHTSKIPKKSKNSLSCLMMPTPFQYISAALLKSLKKTQIISNAAEAATATHYHSPTSKISAPPGCSSLYSVISITNPSTAIHCLS